MSKLEWIIGWGLWPTYFATILVSSTIIRFIMQRGDIQNLELDYNDNDKILFPESNNRNFILISIFSAVYLFIVTYPFLLILDNRFLSYIYGMMTKIEVMSSISIGLTAIVITLSVFIIAFDKDYYLLFSIKDVLRKYKFSYALSIEILSCIFTCLTICTLLDCKMETEFDLFRLIILEYVFFLSVISTIYLLYVLLKIVFFDNKSELKLLDHLYERFWKKNLDTSNIKKDWIEKNTKINVKYLADKYIKYTQNKKIRKTKQIEYIYVKGKYKDIYIKFAKRINIKVMVSLFIISVVVLLKINSNMTIMFIIANFIASLIIIILSIINSKSFNSVIFTFYCDNAGYDVIKNSKEHCFLITAVPIRKLNQFDKYFNSMNSLVAFFYIWLFDKKCLEPDYEQEIAKQFDWLIRYFKYRKCNNLVELFPIFVIGCLCFFKDIFNDELKKLYSQVVDCSDKKFAFQKMIYSQIVYIFSKKQNINNLTIESITKYFEWLDTRQL